LLSVLIDYFQAITFTQALLIALFTSLILWAILWSVEASFYKKSFEHIESLLEFCKDGFSDTETAIYFESKTGEHHASTLFKKIFGLHSQEEIRSFILKKTQIKEEALSLEDAWNTLLNHLEFQTPPFSFPMDIEGQTLFLNGRSINQNAFFWIAPSKTAENDFKIAKRLIDNTPIALWYRNNEGAIVYCNQVYAGAMDQTIETVTSQSLELIPPKRPGSPMQITQKAFETSCPVADRAHAVISGSRRLLEIGVIPFRSGESMGYAFDLQEVETLQKEIQRHLESHQQIMEQLSAPIAIYGPDTRLSFYNNAYVQLFQFKEDWLATKPTLGDILEDLRTRRKLPEFTNFQNYKRERLKFFQTLLTPRQEMIHQPDGHILRMYVSPHPQGGIFYIFEDVSEKIALERRYNTLTAVQKETIDNLYEGIVVFGSDHKLRIMNKAFNTFFGVNDPEWFMGKSLAEVMEFSAPFLPIDTKILQNEITSFFIHRRPNENQITLTDDRVMKYSYLPLPDGSHLISIVDITDTARFQDSLKERNRILEEVDEMKSRFIKHVSYELQSPLSLIQSKVEKLTQQPQEDLETLYEIANTSGDFLKGMRDMLDLASIEAGQLTLMQKDIYLSKFMKSVTSLVSRRAQEQGVHVTIQNDFASSTFHGDEKRLKQAFFNILTSAVKTKSQTQSTTEKEIVFRAETFAKDDLSYITFSLKNSGFKIKKSDIRKLHKITKSTNTGDFRALFDTEFGMTFVKRIAELHSGWIAFETNETNEPEMLDLDFYCYIPCNFNSSDFTEELNFSSDQEYRQSA